ncbi:MAG TPA: 5-formyltetrahydrofolate cyclo-ligase [Alphaproteobacteria bacterium]|nr:5-formyltetrahydrofolate cyclo-ligase [Alphaproteobacteria bacterium]USO06263.1 MAG: 5-formyltetrahydrofolate cyclo-ligase [Rhodospirillales bacterium]HOO81467.1 5-formyltetrahydrofolate cyclo-ligase [Alphaproteobacteria bacterium]
MTDQKTILRDQARKHRTLTDIRAEDPDAATPLFFDALQPHAGQIIAAYWPKGREFDPTGILERALNEGLTCALPKVEADTKILRFIQWTHKTKLVKGAFGILEPEEGPELQPDIFLVPMLAFDRKGYRLGQGGGYYDATLEHYRGKKDVAAVGIAYAAQAVLFNLPAEDHDQPMDWILTPKGIAKYN